MKYCTNCKENQDSWADNPNHNPHETYRRDERCWKCDEYTLVGANIDNRQILPYQQSIDDRSVVINFPQTDNILQIREMTRMAELTIYNRDSQSERELLEDKRKGRSKLQEKISKLEESEDSLKEEINDLERSLPSLKKKEKKEKTELVVIYKGQLSEVRKKVADLKKELSKIDEEIGRISGNISARNDKLVQAKLIQQSQELEITKLVKDMKELEIGLEKDKVAAEKAKAIAMDKTRADVEKERIKLQNNQRTIGLEEELKQEEKKSKLKLENQRLKGELRTQQLEGKLWWFQK